MKTLKLTAIAAAFVVCAFPLAAQQQEAVIRGMTGTVELKQSGGAWKPAKVGDRLSGGTAISTSFRSTAILELGGSLITVRPLTKLTLDDFVRKAGDEQVKLNLQTGRIKASVKAPEGGKTEFTIKSPTATASVRGTELEMDPANITVSSGAVAFAGAGGLTVVAEGGVEITADTLTGMADNPAQKAAAELSAVPALASETGLTGSGSAASSSSAGLTAYLVVTPDFTALMGE